MRSISVPCGASSTSISPEIILACVSGLRPMCEAMSLTTAPALDELADPPAGPRRVVGDDGEVLRAPRLDERVDEAMRRADAHEAADQERRAVGDQCGGRLGAYRDFHLNLALVSRPDFGQNHARFVPLASSPRAVIGPECGLVGRRRRLLVPGHAAASRAGAPADRIGRSLRRLGRRALVAEKVESLAEVFAWRHGVGAGGASGDWSRAAGTGPRRAGWRRSVLRAS